MNGGYVMIDCTGLDLLEQSGQTISKLYDQMVKAYGTNKPVYAVNCNWGGTKIVTPIQVMLIPDVAGDEVMSASALTVRIDVTKSNVVTITNYISE